MTDLATLLKKWFETSTKKQKLVASLAAVGLVSTGILLSLTGASSVANDPLNSTPFYYVSAFVKLIVVLLLIVGAGIVFRRYFQPGMAGKSNRQMRLMETVRLSPKQAIHLVKIGDQRLVVGATDQNISLLTFLDGEPDPVPAEESQLEAGPDFGSMLRSFTLGLFPEKKQGQE